MRNTILLITIAFSILTVLNGCTAMKENAANYRLQTGVLPSKLVASPEEKGLLIIGCDLKITGRSDKIDIRSARISIIKIDSPLKPIMGARFSEKLNLYHGLKPGKYRLYSIRGSKSNYQYKCTFPPEPDFMFEIEAGVPKYIGHVSAVVPRLEKMKLLQITQKYEFVIEWDKDTQLEIEAWEKVQRSYKTRWNETAWNALIDTRIKSLRSTVE